jgi:general L-amino acid transport system permease protein
MSDTSTQRYEPGQHPAMPPPFKTRGVTLWLKENLFSSPTNVVLSLVAIYLLYKIVPGVLEWSLFDAAFTGNDRNECRAQAGGACWAFINERLALFTYGFYPSEERWRVNLSFLMLVVAAVGLLWENCPGRKWLIGFAVIFPFLAGFLLVGGNGVKLVVTLVCIVITLLLMMRGSSTAFVVIIGAVSAFLAKFIFFGGLTIPFTDVHVGGIVDLNQFNLLNLKPVSTDLFGGFMLTLLIGVTGIVFSLPLGILLALGRQSNLPIIKYACIVFIEFIRGVPLITLLFVASTMLSYFLPPGTTFNLLLRVLIMVTLFASAYMAEVVRGGLQAVPKGQTEAADAMGLKYWPSMRLIVLPQALKISIPAIVNTFIGLYKDSVLVIVIGLLDPLGIGRASLADTKWNGLTNEVYLFVAIFFFISCYAMARYSLFLENKLHTGHKR